MLTIHNSYTPLSPFSHYYSAPLIGYWYHFYIFSNRCLIPPLRFNLTTNFFIIVIIIIAVSWKLIARVMSHHHYPSTYNNILSLYILLYYIYSKKLLQKKTYIQLVFSYFLLYIHIFTHT